MEPKNKTLRNTALAIAFAAVGAAAAFGAFFKPSTALAEDRCSVSRAKGRFEKNGIREEDGVYKVKRGPRMASIPKSFIANLRPNDQLDTIISNFEKADAWKKKDPWDCIVFEVKASDLKAPEEKIPGIPSTPIRGEDSYTEKKGWKLFKISAKIPESSRVKRPDGKPWKTMDNSDIRGSVMGLVSAAYTKAMKKGAPAELDIVVMLDISKSGSVTKVGLKARGTKISDLDEKFIKSLVDIFCRFQFEKQTASVATEFPITLRGTARSL